MARTRPAPGFETRTIDDLVVDDEDSFAHVAVYADLKEVLRRDRYAFRVMPGAFKRRWDRALFLNLTFWGAGADGDILCEGRLPADVVAHVAWHHLAAKAFASPRSSGNSVRRAPSFAALALAEAIASAFDVYLIGRLMGLAPRSASLETQVSAMAETASAAGASQRSFRALLAFIARDPERAFEDLRQLLFDATLALRGCSTPAAALSALSSLDVHRFGPLLHRYELSNWLLYARAYGASDVALDAGVRAVDRALRRSGEPLEWLEEAWVRPHLGSLQKNDPYGTESRRGSVFGRRLARTR